MEKIKTVLATLALFFSVVSTAWPDPSPVPISGTGMSLDAILQTAGGGTYTAPITASDKQTVQNKRQFILLSALHFGVCMADGYTTRQGIKSGKAVEGNPFARVFMGNDASAYLYEAAFGLAVPLYTYERTGWDPHPLILPIAIHAGVVGLNLRFH